MISLCWFTICILCMLWYGTIKNIWHPSMAARCSFMLYVTSASLGNLHPMKQTKESHSIIPDSLSISNLIGISKGRISCRLCNWVEFDMQESDIKLTGLRSFQEASLNWTWPKKGHLGPVQCWQEAVCSTSPSSDWVHGWQRHPQVHHHLRAIRRDAGDTWLPGPWVGYSY